MKEQNGRMSEFPGLQSYYGLSLVELDPVFGMEFTKTKCILSISRIA